MATKKARRKKAKRPAGRSTKKKTRSRRAKSRAATRARPPAATRKSSVPAHAAEHGPRYWFFTVDPTRYHWDTLFVKGKELWDGIRNPTAQRYLKQVRRGDRVVCYHGPPDREVYALASIASEPYPNPDPRSEGYLMVDLKAQERLPRPVPLKELKQNRTLRRIRFLAQPRLPVSPLTEPEFKEILRLAGLPPALFR